MSLPSYGSSKPIARTIMKAATPLLSGFSGQKRNEGSIAQGSTIPASQAASTQSAYHMLLSTSPKYSLVGGGG